MSIITITTDNFEQEVVQAKQPVLVDFWAPWCGPCRQLSPLVDELAQERSDIKVGKINVDEQAPLAEMFNVMSIPTLLVFKDGKMANHSVGLVSKQQINDLLK